MSQTAFWKDTVFSDGSPLFVSNPQPAMGERVTVKLRVLHGNPVKRVMLRILRNGGNDFCAMEPCTAEAGSPFDWYSAELTMTQPRLQYHFCLLTDSEAIYYTQEGISAISPDCKHDFVLLADYRQPEWARKAVFYQIFPERFANGDDSLTVKDGEFKVHGFDAVRIADWNTPAGEYQQCHCADFYGGDLVGIRQKIPYLKSLGITALYLNPIFTAPSVHKYDCIDYLQVDPHFGGDEALADLSKELHENGMRLIVDISINHTGTDHRWFNRDCLWFPQSVGAYHNPDSPERKYYDIHEDGTYTCWADVESLPQLCYDSETLRDDLYRKPDSVIRKWLKPPYSIDGWRFDVADVMANSGERQLADEVWPELCRCIRETAPDAYILAEHWDDCTNRLQGDCWDAAMNYYAFGRIIRSFYGAPDPYPERDPDMRRLTRNMRAEDFRARHTSFFSALPFALQQLQYNLFDSHDTGRFRAYPGIDDARLRGATIALFTLPGIPSVYYGDEAGIDGMPYSCEGGRYPMPWGSGFETSEIFKLHQELAALRREHSVFSTGSFRFLYAEGSVLAYTRFDGVEGYLIVLSSSDREETVTFDTAVSGFRFGTDGTALTLTLQPCESLLLKGEKITE